MHWQPTASIENLKQRAKILQKIRAFFYARDVLEVETPSVSQFTVTTPYIASWNVTDPKFPQKKYYLQTSPEYHMKRLLAADSGSIFQICHAFRVDTHSQRHNPEFTMLEWYRVGFTLIDLMNEMDELLQLILNRGAAQRVSYCEIFQKFLQLDPLTITRDELVTLAKQKGLHIDNYAGDKDDWLLLLFSHLIEPNLHGVIFIYDFPASQAALARLNTDDPRLASRFEVYVDGLELANGFHELANAKEQRQRFLADNQKRQELGDPQISLDENFLAALETSPYECLAKQGGLPDCSGVALGIDRLVMLTLNAKTIDEVIAFPITKA